MTDWKKRLIFEISVENTQTFKMEVRSSNL